MKEKDYGVLMINYSASVERFFFDRSYQDITKEQVLRRERARKKTERMNN